MINLSSNKGLRNRYFEIHFNSKRVSGDKAAEESLNRFKKAMLEKK